MITMYKKGEIYDEFKKGGAEGPMFDMFNSSNALIMLFNNHVTENDIERFNNITDIELGLLYYHKQIMITFKTNYQHMDMTYAPQLTHVMEMDELRNISEPEGGLAVHIMLINSKSGKLEALHTVITDLKFNKKLVESIKDKMDSDYSRESDVRELQNIYAMYPNSRKLAKAANVICKIHM